MSHWYVLYTKPHTEYKVNAALVRRGIETFLPEVVTGDSASRRVRQPFFPCYLFMQADLEKIPRSHWSWTPGLRKVVSFGGQPLPMPEQAIGAIQVQLRKINAGGGLAHCRFERGDIVRVVDGPFADFMAVFDGPSTAGDRVRILIHFLGRVNSVTVETGLLEEAPRNAQMTAPKLPRRSRGRGRKIRVD